MIHGTWVATNIANTANISGEVDLGRVWETLMMVIPTIDTTTLGLAVSEKSGGTFQDLHITDTVAADNNRLLSVDGTGAFTWVAPLGGFQYVKIKVTNAQTANRSFKLMGARS